MLNEDSGLQSRIGRFAQLDVAELCAGHVPAVLAELCFGAACTLAFILARLFVDLFAPTAGPFALIYPFTLIATLFGSWRAGFVTYVSAFAWTWYFVRPQAILMHLVRPSDGPRTIVNAVSVLVVLLLAELFRAAVHRGARQRKAAIAQLQSREIAMRELNDSLERQVAERARELSQTWALTPDLLGVLNVDGYFESSNPAWRTILGWTEDQLRKTKIFDFIHPDDIERTYGAWDEVNQGRAVLRFENRFRRADDEWRWLSWVVLPEGSKFYCSARDVTADKDGQTNLAAAEDALRQSQKLEAVGQLTGGVAHDFNNLLTVIIGSVELLRRDNLSAERRRKYVAAIGDTASRAAKLTGQLLAFSRRQSLDPVLFDAGESIREVANMVRTLTGSRVELDIQVPEEVQHILADRSQFDTAIVNMSINARDAMQGEGRLTIAIAPAAGIPAIRAHPPVSGDFVAVKISDTGQGIDAADVDRIFEPFFTTKSVGEGTGLGLSQAFGFAKQSGGDIDVSSPAAGGATFTLYLPRAGADAAVITVEPAVHAAGDGQGNCVLVVEDNAQVGEFATQALRELGFDSVLAHNAADALAELAKDSGRFQIVFSDVVMPGMNGVELAGEIRRLYPALPVILASGYSNVLAENGKRGVELLHKPYSIEQLSRVLQKAIGPRCAP